MPVTFATPEDIAAVYAEVVALRNQIAGLTGGAAFRFLTAGENTIEKFSALQMAGATGNLFHRLAWLRVGEVKRGDLIDASGNFQVSSQHAYNVMIGSTVRLHEGPGTTRSTSFSDWPGQEVSEAQAQNIDNQIHHMPILRHDRVIADRDYADAYMTLIAYCAASQMQTGDTVIVDQDYARLTVIIHPAGSFS